MSHTPGSDIPNTGEIEREPLKVICQLETLTITYPIFFNCLILRATILNRDGPLLVGILITAVSSLNIVSYNGYIFHFKTVEFQKSTTGFWRDGSGGKELVVQV